MPLTPFPPQKILIAHDYVEQTDGGSRLCLEYGRAVGADFMCGFIRAGHPFLAAPYPGRIIEIAHVRPAPPLVRQWLLARAFAGVKVHGQYDCVIYSGSYAPLAVPPKEHRSNGRHIYYCHTPPRFAYDQHDFYLQSLPRFARPLLRAFCAWFRPRYEKAVRNMDAIVTNSDAVRERIRRFLQRDALVIPPPCAVERHAWRETEGYYLSMVRLDKAKRVDAVVRAFMRMPDKHLVICSDGPEGEALRAMARGCANIAFCGVLSEEELRGKLSAAIATICVSIEEDFGMCAVESLAAGKPVIIASAGGIQEIIRHGRTGLCLSADPTPDEIVCAVKALDAPAALAMRAACAVRAQDYSPERFAASMAEVLQ